MKKILLTVFLLLAATVSAQAAEKLANEYFSVDIPAGWEKVETMFGLSQEEKKVYGANFLAAADKDGLAPMISVHYYAPGNIVHRTAEKFIKLHAESVFGVALNGEKYGPVKEGLVCKRRAKIFERNTFEFVPPESIKQKKIPVYEKFAVVPAKEGFYVLSLYSPGEDPKANLKAYGSALASFKPLVD